MTDWVYVQENPAEQLAQLHTFSFIKRQNNGEVAFRITIKEFASPPPGQRMRFFAEADKAVNRKPPRSSPADGATPFSMRWAIAFG